MYASLDGLCTLRGGDRSSMVPAARWRRSRCPACSRAHALHAILYASPHGRALPSPQNRSPLTSTSPAAALIDAPPSAATPRYVLACRRAFLIIKLLLSNVTRLRYSDSYEAPPLPPFIEDVTFRVLRPAAPRSAALRTRSGRHHEPDTDNVVTRGAKDQGLMDSPRTVAAGTASARIFTPA
ncbi:hypothetical protein PsYK624_074700 [Phanerochaete sordida]|uniref:Uncharacterized protein n=1 Tax=Phanerochaete sordida TaxID=48140 RepID=A0A9P3GAQ2_9APHY|nr:hypothetical protein PsYK624_074700 [Phanerochaete sordida]